MGRWDAWNRKESNNGGVLWKNKILVKKYPFVLHNQDDGSEIEKKVDEILNAHSEVLRKGRGTKRTIEKFSSSKREQPSLFFNKK